MVKGWIKIYRKLEDNVLWKNNEPFDRRSAWIDLLLMANYEDSEMLFDGKPFTVKRGECLTSVRKLSVKWSWSKDRVLKFLRLIESTGMITKSSTNKRTLIIIVNYEVYQGLIDTDKDADSYTDKDADSYTDKDTGSPHNKNNKNTGNEETKKDIEESSLRSDSSCGAPNKSPQPPAETPEPVFIKIPLIDKTDFDVTEKMVAEYKELYPAVNVEQALRNMRGWCLEKSAQRKTRQGVTRFIGNWLRKEQDRGGTRKTDTRTSFMDD